MMCGHGGSSRRSAWPSRTPSRASIRCAPPRISGIPRHRSAEGDARRSGAACPAAGSSGFRGGVGGGGGRRESPEAAGAGGLEEASPRGRAGRLLVRGHRGAKAKAPPVRAARHRAHPQPWHVNDGPGPHVRTFVRGPRARRRCLGQPSPNQPGVAPGGLTLELGIWFRFVPRRHPAPERGDQSRPGEFSCDIRGKVHAWHDDLVSAAEKAEGWFARWRPLPVVLRWVLEGKQSEDAYGWGAPASPFNVLCPATSRGKRAISRRHASSSHAPRPTSAVRSTTVRPRSHPSGKRG